MTTRRLRVYLAGPLTSGGAESLAGNVRIAIISAHKLMLAGYAVYCPHLSHFQDLVANEFSEITYQGWLNHDLEWLRACDVMYRLPGESRGADAEEAEARHLGMPVYRSLSALMESEATYTSTVALH